MLSKNVISAASALRENHQEKITVLPGSQAELITNALIPIAGHVDLSQASDLGLEELLFTYESDLTELIGDSVHRSVHVILPLVQSFSTSIKTAIDSVEFKPHILSDALTPVINGYDDWITSDFMVESLSMSYNSNMYNTPTAPADVLGQFDVSYVTKSHLPVIDNIMQEVLDRVCVGGHGFDHMLALSYLLDFNEAVRPDLFRFNTYVNHFDLYGLFVTYFRNISLDPSVRENPELLRTVLTNYEYWASVLRRMIDLYDIAVNKGKVIDTVNTSNMILEGNLMSGSVVLYKHNYELLIRSGVYWETVLGVLLDNRFSNDSTVNDILDSKDLLFETYNRSLSRQENDFTTEQRSTYRYRVAKAFEEVIAMVTPEWLSSRGYSPETVSALDLTGKEHTSYHSRTDEVTRYLENIPTGSYRSIEEIGVDLIAGVLFHDDFASRMLKSFISINEEAGTTSIVPDPVLIKEFITTEVVSAVFGAVEAN